MENLLFLGVPILKHIRVVYPITLQGQWATTDDFPTIPFHLVLFSAARAELAKTIPVHSFILSSHHLSTSSFFLSPSPFRIVFAYLNCKEYQKEEDCKFQRDILYLLGFIQIVLHVFTTNHHLRAAIFAIQLKGTQNISQWKKT